MNLFLKACSRLSEKSNIIQTRGVRVKIVGDLSNFPSAQQEVLRKLEKDTENNVTCVLKLVFYRVFNLRSANCYELVFVWAMAALKKFFLRLKKLEKKKIAE